MPSSGARRGSLSAYRDLLTTPSVAWLLGTSIVGRFNQGMTGLAILLLATQHTSYAVAGVSSAGGVVGSLIAGPVLSRLADARGRRRVLAVTSVLYGILMLTLAVVPFHLVLLPIFALLAGLCSPPLTASVRAALPALVRPDQQQSVFALESALQEVIFVLGPSATALLATFGGPRLAIAASGALVVIGNLAYVRDRDADVGRPADRPVRSGQVLGAPGILRVLAAATALVGAFAGEVVGVVAMVSGAHASANSGFALACGSLGSLVGGFAYGSVHRHRVRLRHLLLLNAAGLAALTAAPNPAVLTALLFCWGLTVAPAMSQLLAGLSAQAPTGAATEAFGWLASAFVVGNFTGTSLSGVLATAFGGRAAIFLGAGSAVLAALVCEPWRARKPEPTRANRTAQSTESTVPNDPGRLEMLTADLPAAEKFAAERRIRADLGREATLEAVADLARRVRRSDLEMIGRAGLGHIGSDFSVIDILATLYGAILAIDPANPGDLERDRFILSKGHAAGALYSTLAQCGFFPLTELASFAQPLSALNGHPNRTKVPGVETNTGPLGHGLPVAVGCALAAKLQGSSRRTFVVLGDGELQEGSNWEAAMTASHYALGSLTAIVDRNRLQQGARTEETSRLEPLADKWTSFGWEVRETDGHDYDRLLAALEPSSSGQPVCVLANTIKGKGVSFMEDRVEWHHKVPNPDQIIAAREELAA